MQEEIPLEELCKKGKMTKAPWLMTEPERKEWEIRVKQETKIYLFSIGQPLVHGKDGHLVAEYADGTVKRLR